MRGGRRAARGGLVVHLARTALVDGSADADTAPVLRAAASPSAVSHSARVGFVVSRSVGDAVTRNLVVRRLRHLVREQLDGLPPDTILVVRALPSAAARSYAQLGLDLAGALRRLLPGRPTPTPTGPVS